MKGLDNYLALYIISNAVALLILLAAWKTPKIARLLFFLLFAWASYTNCKFAVHNPTAYLEYANLSFLNIYIEFIQGWFSRHIMAAVGFIATCQGLIAISMLLKGWIFKTGCIGAMIFLIAIAPLGVGSGFPCTVIMAAALLIILKKSPAQYLWMKDHREKVLQPEIFE
ncbi:MAG TPA: hypothetical protein VFW07_12200 [Parafilimonas sp.]|nr:hypothetical protein [Parafilimonas sp.]